MNRGAGFLSGLLLFIIIFIMSCRDNGNDQRMSLKALPPIVIRENGTEIFQYWEFKNDPFLWDTNYVQPPALESYKDSLSKVLGKDTLQFLLHELAFQDTSYRVISTKNGDSINAQLVHAKTLGKIRPINYLEAQLLDYQISRYPLLSHPTEFHGFVLFHDTKNLVRVYFAASDQPWPPKPGVILEATKNDLKQGWVLKYHLHNHYEPKSNHYLGILAPSMTDAQYYLFLSEEYGLQQSLITNGFFTVEIRGNEFQKLMLPGNK
jgi:hypothetical protein